VIWETRLYTSFHAAPLVHEGVIYVIDEGGTLFALDVETGGAIWRCHGEANPYTSPAAVEGLVLFSGRDGSLYAIAIPER
jgi:outer membrane protein assembly factor BamB